MDEVDFFKIFSELYILFEIFEKKYLPIGLQHPVFHCDTVLEVLTWLFKSLTQAPRGFCAPTRGFPAFLSSALKLLKIHQAMQADTVQTLPTCLIDVIGGWPNP